MRQTKTTIVTYELAHRVQCPCTDGAEQFILKGTRQVLSWSPELGGIFLRTVLITIRLPVPRGAYIKRTYRAEPLSLSPGLRDEDYKSFSHGQIQA